MGSPVAAGCRPAHFLLLALVALAAGAGKASAASFLVLNLCPFPVWPAAFPMSRIGTAPVTKLEHSKAWFGRFAAGTKAGRIWGRTDCDFSDGNHGMCRTGDCAGALECESLGNSPATVAEFTAAARDASDATDSFRISLDDGFNLPLDVACAAIKHTVVVPKEWLRCRERGCPDAMKVHSCSADSQYLVVFCPFKD